MKQLLVILILCPFFLIGQTQIGQDIDGLVSRVENRLGSAVKLSQDGSVLAISARENTSVKYKSGQVTLFSNTNGVWTQIGQDIDGEAERDYSGWSLSLSSDGNIVAIGAPNNDGNGNGSGHVRIYKNENGVWTQIGEDIDGESEFDNSGHSVSLSSDGSIVAIGAPNNDGNGNDSGHIRIYKNENGVWIQIGEDIDGELEDDESGYSVDLSSDGSIVAIGAPNNDGDGNISGHVRIYKNENGVWIQIGEDINGKIEDDKSGYSLELSSDGTTIIIVAHSNDGSSFYDSRIRIYKNENGVWTQKGQHIDNEEVVENYLLRRASVGLSSDGNTIAIGSIMNIRNSPSGHARVYNFENNLWTQIGSNIDGDNYVSSSNLSSCSLSSDGSIVAIGASDENRVQGAVYVYKNEGGIWTQIGNKINGEAEGDRLGYSLSLSSEGSIVAIGAPNNDENGNGSGHVRIYKNENGVWIQIGEDIDGEAAGDQSGWSVSLSLDGSIVAIGALTNDGNGLHSGHVRIYRNISNVWTQVGADIDGAFGDRLGSSVELSQDGTIVAVGAFGNNGNGVNSGHVRIYKNNNDVWTQIGQDIKGEAKVDNSGWSLSLSSDGTIVAIGAHRNDGNGRDSGHVRIYKNDNGVWTQIGEDIDGEAKGDNSGFRVELSSDGSIVAIGAPKNDGNGSDSGHVRIYKNDNGVWTQVGIDIKGEAEGDDSGWRLSLSSDGSIIAIGAPLNNGNGPSTGHVRVYDLSVVLSTKSFEKDYFSYYPNPVNDVLNINLNKGLELKQINIYNLQSQHLYSIKTSKIDVSKLSSGMYFIEVETNQGKSAKKIVVE